MGTPQIACKLNKVEIKVDFRLKQKNHKIAARIIEFTICAVHNYSLNALLIISSDSKRENFCGIKFAEKLFHPTLGTERERDGIAQKMRKLKIFNFNNYSRMSASEKFALNCNI